MRNQDWRGLAACAGEDPGLFFPPAGTNGTRAKRICARCPVQAECLQDAVDTFDRHGIRGGLSPDERRGMKRSPAAATGSPLCLKRMHARTAANTAADGKCLACKHDRQAQQPAPSRAA